MIEHPLQYTICQHRLRHFDVRTHYFSHVCSISTHACSRENISSFATTRVRNTLGRFDCAGSRRKGAANRHSTCCSGDFAPSPQERGTTGRPCSLRMHEHIGTARYSRSGKKLLDTVIHHLPDQEVPTRVACGACLNCFILCLLRYNRCDWCVSSHPHHITSTIALDQDVQASPFRQHRMLTL